LTEHCQTWQVTHIVILTVVTVKILKFYKFTMVAEAILTKKSKNRKFD